MQSMTFSEIFDRILRFWPERIAIGDGRPIPIDGDHEATPHTSPEGGVPWLFPTLSRASDEVEEKIDHQADTWGSLMAWTMFQVFHARAKELREGGSDTLLTRTISREIFEQRYYENLHSEDWTEELAAYRRT
jgi:hypothetical protein